MDKHGRARGAVQETLLRGAESALEELQRRETSPLESALRRALASGDTDLIRQIELILKPFTNPGKEPNEREAKAADHQTGNCHCWISNQERSSGPGKVAIVA